MLFFLVASESLSLSFSLSLVHGSLRRHAHLSVRPSVRPARGCLCLHPHPSAFVFPFLLAGSSCLEPPSCVFGEVFPIFQTREPVSGAGQGGGRVCPPPRSSEHLRPSPMGASSQEPSVPPSATRGFLRPGLLAKANPRSVSCWQCLSLAPQSVSIFICPGDGPGGIL